VFSWGKLVIDVVLVITRLFPIVLRMNKSIRAEICRCWRFLKGGVTLRQNIQLDMDNYIDK